jgi:hypothetical protein
MRRDGFGSVSPLNPAEPAQLVTHALDDIGPCRMAVNAAGLSPDAGLRVELLDESGQPLPGYAGENAAVLHESGVDTQVRWPTGAAVARPGEPFRIRVEFGGRQCGQAQLYALYVTAAAR